MYQASLARNKQHSQIRIIQGKCIYNKANQKGAGEGVREPWGGTRTLGHQWQLVLALGIKGPGRKRFLVPGRRKSQCKQVALKGGVTFSGGKQLV